MKKSIYLNETENLAIQMLAEGKRLKDIREKTEVPVTRFPFFLAELRRKTGISDIQNIEECTSFLKEVPDFTKEVILSEQESRLLKALIEGKSLAYEANILHISHEDAKRSLSNALKKCGIFSKEARTQRVQTRFFFAIHGIPHSKLAPLSPEHWNVLRILANGGRLEEVQNSFVPRKSAKYAKEYIREACERIGANSAGRGTRRNIICAFLEAFELRQKEKNVKLIALDRSEVTPEQYSNFFRAKIGTTLEGLAEDLELSIEEATIKGLKMCKRAGFDCSDEEILKYSPKSSSASVESPVSMDDPAF